MNKGETDEIIIQLYLIYLREKAQHVNILGRIESVCFINKTEYHPLPKNLDIENIKNLDTKQILGIAKHCGISKAGIHYKADTIINGIPISLKSMNYSPPALVNHTTRPGFELAQDYSDGNINLLDSIIDEYWNLRENNQIGEDVKNEVHVSPFRNQKEAIKPFLNYFLFIGTGSRPSKLPAQKILSFGDPTNEASWKILDKSNAVEQYWDKLIFSLRSKKGMPSGYPNKMTPKMNKLKHSIDRWTRYIDGEYRGALHIRTK